MHSINDDGLTEIEERAHDATATLSMLKELCESYMYAPGGPSIDALSGMARTLGRATEDLWRVHNCVFPGDQVDVRTGRTDRVKSSPPAN